MNKIINRRDFLSSAAMMGAAGTLGVGALLASCGSANKMTPFKPIKFGIISDIHHTATPDTDERLEVFMKKVEEEKPDFLMSLGDFAHPIQDNESFAKRFASSQSPAYHVLGNHEMDQVDKKRRRRLFRYASALLFVRYWRVSLFGH